METEEKQVELFREQIRQLKEEYWNQLMTYTEKSPEQDPSLLNSYIKQMEDLYNILRPILEGKKAVTDLPNENLVAIFQPIFPEETPHYVFSSCLYYARRDLLMFPLTRDTARINSLPDKNSMQNVEFLSNE
jgi:hypothetical protein